MEECILPTINSSLANKQATITGAASTIASSNLTASRALVSNSSGKVAVSAVTSTELGCLDGVTSNVQTQIDSVKKSYLPLAGGILTGDVRPSTTGARSLGTDAYNFAGVYSNHYLIGNSSGSRLTDIYNSGNILIFGVTDSATVRSRTSINTYLPISASAFNVSSSKRYKENINDITEERAKKILDVNVVTYDYRCNIMSRPLDKTGVIAEDVESIIPEVVSYTTIDDEEVPDSVDYSKFVPYLIKMIQIQQDEIDKLKNS